MSDIDHVRKSKHFIYKKTVNCKKHYTGIVQDKSTVYATIAVCLCSHGFHFLVASAQTTSHCHFIFMM